MSLTDSVSFEKSLYPPDFLGIYYKICLSVNSPLNSGVKNWMLYTTRIYLGDQHPPVHSQSHLNCSHIHFGYWNKYEYKCQNAPQNDSPKITGDQNRIWQQCCWFSFSGVRNKRYSYCSDSESFFLQIWEEISPFCRIAETNAVSVVKLVGRTFKSSLAFRNCNNLNEHLTL